MVQQTTTATPFTIAPIKTTITATTANYNSYSNSINNNSNNNSNNGKLQQQQQQHQQQTTTASASTIARITATTTIFPITTQLQQHLKWKSEEKVENISFSSSSRFNTLSEIKGFREKGSWLINFRLSQNLDRVANFIFSSLWSKLRISLLLKKRCTSSNKQVTSAA